MNIFSVLRTFYDNNEIDKKTQKNNKNTDFKRGTVPVPMVFIMNLV
jgi:hypothetical protein